MQETLADPAPHVIPGVDAFVGGGRDRIGVDPALDRIVVKAGVGVEPVVEIGGGDLRVELDAPAWSPIRYACSDESLLASAVARAGRTAS